ncbi:MAG TPA: tRNA dimethylallyltransferase, partial [Gemmatimonadota bacterium]|nr:tRNA dimethylallyltransferase [Gemmatimonadota bacterium]
GRFARLARGWIRGIRAGGGVPVLAGGTGFFLSALTDPPFREPELAPGRRRALEARLSELGDEELRRWTRRLDPALARELDALDPQRCARTLELALLSGRPVTWWQRHGEPEGTPLRFVTFALELPGQEHRERIRARTRAQLEGGWTEEVEALLAGGRGPDDPALSALGYRAVADLVRGERSLEEVAETIAGETWQYARRQRTWFRHQLPGDAVRLDARRPVGELADRVARGWEGRGRTERADGAPDGAGDRDREGSARP